MRRLLVPVVVLIVVGCAKKEDGGRADPEKGGAAPVGPTVTYAGEYEAGNPIAADAKYKGKRVVSQRVEIDRISRTKDGRSYVAPLSVIIQAPSRPAGTAGMGGHRPQAVPEPCYFFFLRPDAEAKDLKPGDTCDVTGTCRGHQRDNYWRGDVPGMDWHVDFDDCVVKRSK